MSPLEWLRRQRPPLSPRHRARLLEACEAMDASVRTGDGPKPVAVVQVADNPGITVAQAAANIAAVTTAMWRGDPLVACGCWPRYVGDCRCEQRPR